MKKKAKGFTLIELIIVMSIIMVVASFLVPKFNGYMIKAKNLKAIDTGRQIYLSVLESYAEGNENFNNDEIIKNTQELLGLSDIQVISTLDSKISINYNVDNKEYNLTFDDKTNGFTIQDSKKQILYPKNNIKKISEKAVKE